MISARPYLLLVTIAFALLALRATEGRLFDPTAPVRDGESGVSDDGSPDAPGPSIAIDAATSKLASFVELSKQGSMCEHIRPDELPEECICSEPRPYALVIECVKTFNSTFFNDTIGMKIDLDPCNAEGSKMSLDVTEKEHHIDYPIAGISAGESKKIPIPGLAMIVPGVGNVGLDVAVLILGNPDMLKLKIGLTACAQTSAGHVVCASSIPGLSNIFPWYILEGTYTFGDICQSDGVDITFESSADAEEPTTMILAE